MDKYEKTKSYDIEKINEVRRSSGLKEILTKTRTCLRCGRKFTSEGNYNRLCNYCRKFNVSEYGAR